ncbi:MAG: hypothetical protein JRN27_01220 [Nitrososphaerota archaeon]|nr:hypothetical protein [Nitrososphaerota archaeon]MDG6974703.1 hypothetical protein [Nitrososphaerota archaeon]MDG7009961.1 hypothetical protein [Nitrososphaerota archaeon]MDG7019038.1 hypothetical protein [Nitrososphaerota archaeon]
MIGEKLLAREAEVLKLLKTLGPERPYTLIGGYAVDAYSALPRYSVDLDIVVAKPQLGQFAPLLEQGGFADNEEPYMNEIEGVETRKFTKPVEDEQVSVDLLVGGVRCRQTEAVWKVGDISETAKVLRVVGVSDSAPARVASRELLIALKLHSGRDPDLRDVVMLSADADWSVVRALGARGSKSKMKKQLEHAVEVLGEPDFEGRLKAYFSSRQNESARVRVAVTEIGRFLNRM